eukprot:600050-Alexandrium_andersonii.AAC.1
MVQVPLHISSSSPPAAPIQRRHELVLDRRGLVGIADLARLTCGGHAGPGPCNQAAPVRLLGP